jgi:hypothetical protein
MRAANSKKMVPRETFIHTPDGELPLLPECQTGKYIV